MKAPKMNILYKIGFILMFVCLALFIASVVVILVVEERTAGVLMAVAGVFLCLIAIILTMFSKPKKPKEPKYRFDDNSIVEINTVEMTSNDVIDEEEEDG